MRTGQYILIGFLLTALAMVSPGCRKKKTVLDLEVTRLLGEGTPKELVQRAFEAKNPDVRRAALESLSRTEWAIRDPHIKRFARHTRPEAEENSLVRAVCVRAIGRSREKKYLPQVITALTDSASIVRWDAALVLDTMPSPSAVDPLRGRVLDDESVDVRASCARALRHYRTDVVFRTLLRSLMDEEFTVRNETHKSLVQITGRDLGYEPENWSKDNLGNETIPTSEVKYTKRPWWDWAGVTKRTQVVNKPSGQPAASPKQWNRPWWDWGGVTKPKTTEIPPAPESQPQ